MRKILAVFIISLLCVTGHAQKKLFLSAIEEGRQPTGFYTLHNDKSRMLRMKDMQEFAEKNDYILGSSTGKEISRFGDVDTSISTLEFLPISEYESYIYANINKNNIIDLTKIPCVGSGYCFVGWDNINDPFMHLNEIHWSGSENNGLLEGSGMGYYRNGKDKIVFIEGRFVNGFPMGETRTIIYNMAGKFDKYSSSRVTSTMSVTLGKMSDGMASIEKDGLSGFVNDQGHVSIKPVYKRVVQEFTNGQATVYDEDRKKEIVINRQGAFVDFSAYQKQVDREAELESQRKRAQAQRDCDQGKRYLRGDGAPQDVDQAVALFTKAAEAGNADGQFYTGYCCYMGIGVSKNYQAAVEWIKKAAEQDQPEAQYFLGFFYENEIGGLHQKELAEGWYMSAADKGESKAEFALGRRNFEVGEYDRAIEWYEKAAEHENAAAMNALGQCYFNGYGVDKNTSKAIDWYQRGADLGDDEAQYQMGYFYQQGIGVHKNIAKAKEWYRRSAEQGNGKATNAIEELGGTVTVSERTPEREAEKAISLIKEPSTSSSNDSIEGLVVKGKNLSSLSAYLEGKKVNGEEYYFELSTDMGNYKYYILYQLTSKENNVKRGTVKATVSTQNGIITVVDWE